MWRSMNASWYYKGDVMWVERTKIVGLDGNTSTVDVEYERIMIWFTPLPRSQWRQKEGYMDKMRAQAIVPYPALHDASIIPSTLTSFIRYNNEMYRITEITDRTRQWQNHTYKLMLERVEMQ